MTLAVLTFSEALAIAQATGAKIARKGWNGAGQHVRACNGGQITLSDRSSITYERVEPLMVLFNAQQEYVAWTPSQGDLFATDWMELPQ